PPRALPGDPAGAADPGSSADGPRARRQPTEEGGSFAGWCRRPAGTARAGSERAPSRRTGIQGVGTTTQGKRRQRGHRTLAIPNKPPNECPEGDTGPVDAQTATQKSQIYAVNTTPDGVSANPEHLPHCECVRVADIASRQILTGGKMSCAP